MRREWKVNIYYFFSPGKSNPFAEEVRLDWFGVDTFRAAWRQNGSRQATTERPNVGCLSHTSQTHEGNYMHCAAILVRHMYTSLTHATALLCHSRLPVFPPRVLLRPSPWFLNESFFICSLGHFSFGALGDPQGYDPPESGPSFIQTPTDTTDPFSFGVLLEASCGHLSCISAQDIYL